MTERSKEIILLIITLTILLILGELFFREYYLFLGKPVAANNDELCFKQMKLPQSYLSVSTEDFRYKPEWDEHPLIGLIPSKDFQYGVSTSLTINNQIVPSKIYAAQYHNSQHLTNIEEFPLQKSKQIKIRIALFGDSFTCGSESALRFNVASVLKELIPNSEILNFCMVGQGIDTMYARYELEGKQYNPDIVIFIVLVDDLRRAFECPLFRPNLIISDNNITVGQRKWPTLQDFYFNYSLPTSESYLAKHILWVFDQQTRYQRNLQQGFELFNVMLDQLKIKTAEQVTTLIVIPLLEQEPYDFEVEFYGNMLELLHQKNILFLDSVDYLAANKKIYNNQSFYYIRAKDHYKHFSPIGNAVFAQGIKQLLEQERLVNQTPNYYFANFQNFEFIYFIPQNLTHQIEGRVKVIPAFTINNSMYDDHFILART